MLAFCIRSVHLDSHCDIRGKYISSLLQTVLDKIVERGCDRFSRDTLVALLCSAKRLLLEISKGVSVVEPDSKFTLIILVVVPCSFVCASVNLDFRQG